MTGTRSQPALVWRDMDQKALDDAYDQDVYAPNRPLIVTRRIAASERARAIVGPPQRVAYGPSEYERLDIFRAPLAKGERAPVNVFVHGGAWRRNKGPDYHLQAEPLVRAGAHCVILDFINVEQAGGDLFPMYEQVRRAIAWTWRNADEFRRRPRAVLHLGAFVGLASRRLRARPRLARGRPAGEFLQGRVAPIRHVRPRTSAALETLLLRRASPTRWSNN